MTTDQVFDSPQIILSYCSVFTKIKPNVKLVITESRRDGFIFQDVFINFKEISFIHAKGKSVCLQTSKLHSESGQTNCVALVDADFDNVITEKYNYPVILTDFYDLESYSINSENWKRILREIINLEKLKKYNITVLEDLRNICVTICAPLCAALYINNREEMGISFEKYQFDSKCKIDFVNLTNSIENTVERLKQLNANKDINIIKYKQEVTIFLDKINLSHRHLIVSSTIFCNCLYELIREKELFRQEFQASKFSALYLLRWFRSAIRPVDIENSRMYENVRQFALN